MKESRTTEFLTEVTKRVHLFIEPVTAEILECFLQGFVRGVLVGSLSIDDVMYRRTQESVARSRGWEHTAAHLYRQMRARGLPEEQIIRERLAIEVETWRRLESGG